MRGLSDRRETSPMKKSMHHLIAVAPRWQSRVEMTIGVDLGDVWSHYCTLNEDGEVVDRGRFRTTPKAIEKWFANRPPARVAMEAGVHSIWISRSLDMRSSWRTSANCGLSLTAIAKAIRSMPRSWLGMRGLIPTSFDRSPVTPSSSRKRSP
jgi:hypothetical protein